MKWKFIEDPPDQSHSDEEWYALNNGYIKPEAVLADQAQIDALEAAIDLIHSFFDALDEAGIRTEM